MARIARAARRTRQSKTAVWYERARVGTLTRATDGAIAFSYDPDWLASEAAFPVASALPLTKLKGRAIPLSPPSTTFCPMPKANCAKRSPRA